MKVVLVVMWILGVGAQPPITYQVQFDSLDLCNAAAEKITSDAARLEKERADDLEAAQEGLKNPDLSRMFSAMRGNKYAVSAVCLVTSAGP